MKKAACGLMAFNIDDRHTPVQCFSMYLGIFAYIKKAKISNGLEKCKGSNFILHLCGSSVLLAGVIVCRSSQRSIGARSALQFISQRRSSNVTFNCPGNASRVNGEYVIQPKSFVANGM